MLPVRMPTIYFTALLLMRLLLVLAVVLSFAQRQVHAQPPLLRFSTPALALILASEFVQAQPPEFEVVGDGACLDCGAGNGNHHGAVQPVSVPSGESVLCWYPTSFAKLAKCARPPPPLRFCAPSTSLLKDFLEFLQNNHGEMDVSCAYKATAGS
eukprot:scaffold25896_cov228-Skeletonema_marinoi.AAC.1